MYTIVGASGNTGSMVAEKLLAAGKQVRGISRNPDHLEWLTSRGGEARLANATDPAELTEAFRGAEGVYAMIPPNISAPDVAAYQDRVSEALAIALQASGAPKAVVLSSIGADKPEKTGPVVGLHRLEEKLNGLGGLEAVYIRAGYFMENLLPQIQVVRRFGTLAGPLRPDLPLPFIAARDIGALAGELLANPEFRGKQIRELLGQRDITYTEAASIVGDAIGRPGLGYNQIPPAQLREVLVQTGMSESMADLLLEMSEALNSGYMAPLEPRSESNTTPTPLEDFVQEEFAPRFRAA